MKLAANVQYTLCSEKKTPTLVVCYISLENG